MGRKLERLGLLLKGGRHRCGYHKGLITTHCIRPFCCGMSHFQMVMHIYKGFGLKCPTSWILLLDCNHLSLLSACFYEKSRKSIRGQKQKST
jgi:hypothetical protein